MKRITLLLLSVMVFSCGKETVEKPKHLLTEDEMANIIYDITMIQSIRTVKPTLLSDNDVDAKEYIYKKYKIDSLDLVQNNAWYAADMENYEKIQKKASERINKENEAALPKKDSAAQSNKNHKPDRAALRQKHENFRKSLLEKQKAQQK